MKKLSSLAIVAMFAALVLSSCKKDYTCSCHIFDSTGLLDSTYNTTINDKKDDAKTACEKDNGATPFYGDTITVDCSIK